MGEPKSEQVNVRLTEQEHDIVRALVFLSGGSAGDVVRQVVTDFLAVQAADPDVQAALTALAARRAREAGTLRTLKRSRAKQT